MAEEGKEEKRKKEKEERKEEEKTIVKEEKENKRNKDSQGGERGIRIVKDEEEKRDSGAEKVEGGSEKGKVVRFIKRTVEGPIGRVAARVHLWGTAGGFSPSAPSGRGCPENEGTPPVAHASKTHRLMGASLTKQSRVSLSR